VAAEGLAPELPGAPSAFQDAEPRGAAGVLRAGLASGLHAAASLPTLERWGQGAAGSN